MINFIERIRNAFDYANIIIDETGIKLCYTGEEWINQTLSVADMELMRQLLEISCQVSVICNTKSIIIHLSCDGFEKSLYGIYVALNKPKDFDLYEFLKTIPVTIDLLRIRKAIRFGNAEEVINEVLLSKMKRNENIRVHSGRYKSIYELARRLPVELACYPPENSNDRGFIEMYIPEPGITFGSEMFQIFRDLVNISYQIDFEFNVPDRILNLCLFA